MATVAAAVVMLTVVTARGVVANQLKQNSAPVTAVVME